jgi:outer membrane protein assembly factor BamB
MRVAVERVFHVKHIHNAVHNQGSEGSPCGQIRTAQDPISSMARGRRLAGLSGLVALSALLLAGCGGIATAAGWAAPARMPDGSILVQVKPGEVRAIDPVSGAERWHFPSSVKDEKASKRTSRPVKGTFYASPVFDQDRIYLVSYEGHLVRIDRAQGAGEISSPWTVELGESVVATPVLSGSRLFVPTEAGEVLVVNTEDGTVASRYRLESGRIWGAPLISGENLILPNFDRKTIDAMRLSDGKAAWSTGDAGASVTDVVPAGQNILVGSLDGSLHALDAGDGGTRWQFKADGWVTGAPLVAGDTIYTGTMGGSVYALTLDGQQRWQFTLDGTKPEFRATPALVDGTLVVVARRGIVVGLDPATGKQRWRSEIADARVDASPLAVDRAVFLATTKHALIRVDAASGATQTISGTGE